MNLAIAPKRLTYTLLAIAIILMLLGMIGILQVTDDRFLVFSALFEVNSESTVSTWYAAFLLGLAALFCGLITADRTQRKQPYTRHWGYLTLILLLMSVDEIALIHERVLNYVGGMVRGDSGGVFYYAWVIPGLVIVFFFALFYAPFFWNLPRRERFQLIAGFGLFAFGAVGMEMVTGWIVSNYDVQVVAVVLLSTVEELCEMLGVIVIILGLLNYLSSTCAVQVTFQPQPVQEAVQSGQPRWGQNPSLTQPE